MISVSIQIAGVLPTGLTIGTGFHCIISVAQNLARARKKLPEGI